MNILINYADIAYLKSQRLNSKTGLEVGGFDKVFSYQPKHIDMQFYKKHRTILRQYRGNGYWLWKPYFILKTLKQMTANDFLFYCDAGAYFVDSVEPIFKLCETTQQDIIPFELPFHKEGAYTKRDAFIGLNLDTEKYTKTIQRLASFLVFRKTDFTVSFVNEWLSACQDEHMLTDIPNERGQANYPEFIAHRRDQSIFSLLSKKHGLIAYRDPSQYGNDSKSSYPDSEYGQLINHTRPRKRTIKSVMFRIFGNSISLNIIFIFIGLWCDAIRSAMTRMRKATSF